jgi:hypothetical protein
VADLGFGSQAVILGLSERILVDPDMMDRAAFLAPLIGEPWAWQSRNCWDFACHVQRELFGRELPRVAVPADLSKRWVLQSIDKHPERATWREVPDGPGGPVTAADGALVLMAHFDQQFAIAADELDAVSCRPPRGVVRSPRGPPHVCSTTTGAPTGTRLESSVGRPRGLVRGRLTRALTDGTARALGSKPDARRRFTERGRHVTVRSRLLLA